MLPTEINHGDLAILHSSQPEASHHLDKLKDLSVSSLKLDDATLATAVPFGTLVCVESGRSRTAIWEMLVFPDMRTEITATTGTRQHHLTHQGANAAVVITLIKWGR